MPVIGIVGGVASGKSTIAAQLQTWGAAVIDGDRIGHEVLLREDVQKAIRRRWGDVVLNPAGQIDRSRLAQAVFGATVSESALASNSTATPLADLEQITHPHIGAAIARQIAALRAASDRHPAIVLDAAVLFKAGWDAQCDYVLFADADDATRLQRSRQRGWSVAQFRARERAQMDVQEKRRRADYVVRTDGSLDELREQLLAYWTSWGLPMPPATAGRP